MRGDLYYVDLSPSIGSEQGGIRPVVVIQNNTGNKFSPTIIVAAITSRKKNYIPTHVELSCNESGLPNDSIILLEQIRTLDKSRLKEKIGKIPNYKISEINDALSVSFGFVVSTYNMEPALAYA